MSPCACCYALPPARRCAPMSSSVRSPVGSNVKTRFGAVGDGKADDTAAIQQALDALRLHRDFCVLYFPAGTYRITDTIRLLRITDVNNEANGVSIIGEDPLKTIIKWDGPAGKSMLFYNPWYAIMSRLTLDGAGTAKTAIQHGEYFSTGNEFSDMVIKDVQFGIEGAVPGQSRHCRDGGVALPVLPLREGRHQHSELQLARLVALALLVRRLRDRRDQRVRRRQLPRLPEHVPAFKRRGHHHPALRELLHLRQHVHRLPPVLPRETGGDLEG